MSRDIDLIIPISKVNPVTIDTYINNYLTQQGIGALTIQTKNAASKRSLDTVFRNNSGYPKLLELNCVLKVEESNTILTGYAGIYYYTASTYSGIGSGYRGEFSLNHGIGTFASSQTQTLQDYLFLSLLIPNGMYYKLEDGTGSDGYFNVDSWIEHKFGGGVLYDIEADVSGGNGDISLDDDEYAESVYGEAEAGDVFTLYIQPDGGYHLLSVTVDSVDKTSEVSGGELSVTMPAEQCDIVVTFEAD